MIHYHYVPGIYCQKTVLFLYNGGIFSGYRSLPALYLSGTPSLKTGTSPPSCLQYCSSQNKPLSLIFQMFPIFIRNLFAVFLARSFILSMFVKEDYLILHYLFLSCLFVAIAVDVLSFLLTHWTAVVVWLVPRRWLVCLNKTYFYPSLNVSTFM